MRHQRAGLHLSRTSAHRRALFSNLVASLFTYERIRTTDAKAKETRRLAERTITWARRVGDVLVKAPDKRSDEERAQVVHAMRMAGRVVRNRGAVVKLFDEIGPRFLGRHGGYTRIVKIGQRPGDAAPMSLLELIPDPNAPSVKAVESADETKEGQPKAKKSKQAKQETTDKKTAGKTDEAKAAKASRAAGAKASAAKANASASSEKQTKAGKPAAKKNKGDK